MTIRLTHVGVLLLLCLGLAACSGGGGKKNEETPPVTVTPQAEKFGAGFGAAFAANPNTDPRTPVDGDIIPLSLTTDPISVE